MSFINYHRSIERLPVRYIASGPATLSTGTSMNCTYPAGILAGDLLFTHLYLRSTGDTITSGPTGYTLLTNDVDTGNFTRQVIYWKIATGSETGSLVITASGGTSGNMSKISVFRGNAQVSPIEGSIKVDANNSVVTHGTITGHKRGMCVSFVGLSDNIGMAAYAGAINTVWKDAYQDLMAAGLRCAIQMQYGVIGADNINVSGGAYTLAGGLAKVYITRSFAIKVV